MDFCQLSWKNKWRIFVVYFCPLSVWSLTHSNKVVAASCCGMLLSAGTGKPVKIYRKMEGAKFRIILGRNNPVKKLQMAWDQARGSTFSMASTLNIKQELQMNIGIKVYPCVKMAQSKSKLKSR
ncbi:hypothetical protein ATANTOWER_019494 [Ataeniobius toweri]|uniref:Uncharacterized protein n=1 Tax=Ataeniobius toweri TaxID=208326 RepID=A0ABU7BBN2_9TELE|nr:hypothetical protein [Ataeniobius toweri]